MDVLTKLKYKIRVGILDLLVQFLALFKLKLGESSSSLLLKMRFQLEIDASLEKQFQDAARKKNASHHWGKIGWSVETAAVQTAEIAAWRDSENAASYYDRVLPAMAGLAERYRHDRRDDSGYALGTVREVERVLIAQAAQITKAD
ncbi:Uncharacterised protein [Zhongshania aliphaticivorans]|uniref:Uncharacterized protein n=1 Tax=Zhongshania aliphaticivorans TaxID=1470434 RepID=A0A5S9NFB6_9GAMM|nr:hypothetical protein [Zhongshania aliphaticivorans]CAA0089091.1 Uncharacterised protein [Zhongshania aliphaticivorans]CAA0095723.1 Uncharacterised protein [Zhongshania aliphaticivorans]